MIFQPKKLYIEGGQSERSNIHINLSGAGNISLLLSENQFQLLLDALKEIDKSGYSKKNEMAF